MHPIERHLKQTNLSGLDGTEAEGTLALSDELINLGLLEALNKLRDLTQLPPAPTPDEAAEARAPGPGIDQRAILAKVNIDRLAYRSEAGKTLLDFKVAFGLD